MVQYSFYATAPFISMLLNCVVIILHSDDTDLFVHSFLGPLFWRRRLCIPGYHGTNVLACIAINIIITRVQVTNIRRSEFEDRASTSVWRRSLYLSGWELGWLPGVRG